MWGLGWSLTKPLSLSLPLSFCLSLSNSITQTFFSHSLSVADLFYSPHLPFFHLSSPLCLSLSASLILSACLSVCLSVYLSVCLSVSLAHTHTHIKNTHLSPSSVTHTCTHSSSLSCTHAHAQLHFSLSLSNAHTHVESSSNPFTKIVFLLSPSIRFESGEFSSKRSTWPSRKKLLSQSSLSRLNLYHRSSLPGFNGCKHYQSINITFTGNQLLIFTISTITNVQSK